MTRGYDYNYRCGRKHITCISRHVAAGSPGVTCSTRSATHCPASAAMAPAAPDPRGMKRQPISPLEVGTRQTWIDMDGTKGFSRGGGDVLGASALALGGVGAAPATFPLFFIMADNPFKKSSCNVVSWCHAANINVAEQRVVLALVDFDFDFGDIAMSWPKCRA